MTENEAYQAITATPPLCDIQNRTTEKKWKTVGYFTAEPHDNPATSKSMIEAAKFTGYGDAWMYANYLARRPNAEWWWAVVVR